MLDNKVIFVTHVITLSSKSIMKHAASNLKHHKTESVTFTIFGLRNSPRPVYSQADATVLDRSYIFCRLHAYPRSGANYTMSSDALLAAPIILDNGSGTIRAGFAGSDIPKCIFPSFVGRPKHTKVLAGGAGSEGDVFVGNKAEELRGLLKLNWPLQHGVVTDWTDMETIWSWVYREGLGVGSDMVCL